MNYSTQLEHIKEEITEFERLCYAEVLEAEQAINRILQGCPSMVVHQIDSVNSIDGRYRTIEVCLHDGRRGELPIIFAVALWGDRAMIGGVTCTNVKEFQSRIIELLNLPQIRHILTSRLL